MKWQLLKCFNRLTAKRLVVKSIHSKIVLFSESLETKVAVDLTPGVYLVTLTLVLTSAYFTLRYGIVFSKDVVPLLYYYEPWATYIVLFWCFSADKPVIQPITRLSLKHLVWDSLNYPIFHICHRSLMPIQLKFRLIGSYMMIEVHVVTYNYI